MDQLPDDESMKQAREMIVYDATGQKVTFGDVLNGNGKTIVVFIRSYRYSITSERTK